ncbi:hypothetical protein COBT_001223 [Conglomerata obtusa]
MISLYQLETYINNLDEKALILWCFEKQILQNHSICVACKVSIYLVVYKRHKDVYAWRCMTRGCTNVEKFFTLRLLSFFDRYRIEIKTILQIILRYACKTSRHSIIAYFGHLDKKNTRKDNKIYSKKNA